MSLSPPDRLTCGLQESEQNVSYFTPSYRCFSVLANMEILTRVTVKYETLPGWCCSTEAVRSFDELPSQAQDYIHFIENFLRVPGL